MNWVRGMLGLVVVVALMASCGGTAGKIRNLANGTAGKRIEKFQQQLQNAQKQVYTADYESKDSNGKTQTIHVAQKPPKSLFKTEDAIVISDGTDTFTCSQSGGNRQMQCLKAAGAGGGSVAGFSQALSGAAVLAAVSAAAIVPGFDAQQSTKDLAGQHLDCVTITKSADNKHPEYCVTQDGILAYVADDSGSSFSLTSYKKEANDSDFTPPGPVVTPDDLAKQALSSATSTTVADSTTSTTVTTATTDTTNTSDTTDTTTP